MARLLAPVGDPISPPLPIPKPEREVAGPVPEGVVAQCGYASILATLADDGETPLFRATFAPGMVDEMVSKGCAQFYQGCNICSVRFDECDAAEKAACTDAACLDRICERKVICSAKTCIARGKMPSCESRLARTQCRRSLFE